MLQKLVLNQFDIYVTTKLYIFYTLHSYHCKKKLEDCAHFCCDVHVKLI